jgi:beta-ring hydroxylase
MFGDCALHGASGPLGAAAVSGEAIEMENFFSRLGLDIIGKVGFARVAQEVLACGLGASG